MKIFTTDVTETPATLPSFIHTETIGNLRHATIRRRVPFVQRLDVFQHRVQIACHPHALVLRYLQIAPSPDGARRKLLATILSSPTEACSMLRVIVNQE